MLGEMQYFNLKILEGHFESSTYTCILTDDMSKELELCMNQLINGERFTSCADISFVLLNMKGMFNGFYSNKINKGTLKMTYKINLCCCC